MKKIMERPRCPGKQRRVYLSVNGQPMGRVLTITNTQPQGCWIHVTTQQPATHEELVEQMTQLLSNLYGTDRTCDALCDEISSRLDDLRRYHEPESFTDQITALLDDMEGDDK